MKTTVSSISKAALSAVAVLFAASTESRGSVTLQIDWGIRPVAYQRYNGTLFKTDDGAEWDVDTFNAGRNMRLAFVGNGTFDETSGFSSMEWVGDPAAARRSDDLWAGSAYLAGSFAVDSSVKLPIEWLGDIDVVDPDAEIYDREEDYYEPLWHSANFATVVYETATKRAWRISESAGGTDFATMSPFTSMITVSPALYPDANYLTLIPAVSSGAVYLGAEIPQRCVWMADKIEEGGGAVTAEDFAGWSDATLDLAAVLDVLPEQAAGGVVLKIDSIEKSGDGFEISWTFAAVDSSGAARDVTALRGGAELRLETASTLDGLGATHEALDPAARSATLDGSATAGFARLVLAIP